MQHCSCQSVCYMPLYLLYFCFSEEDVCLNCQVVTVHTDHVLPGLKSSSDIIIIIEYHCSATYRKQHWHTSGVTVCYMCAFYCERQFPVLWYNTHSVEAVIVLFSVLVIAFAAWHLGLMASLLCRVISLLTAVYLVTRMHSSQLLSTYKACTYLLVCFYVFLTFIHASQ